MAEKYIKILLAAPQSEDTILGTIGRHCKSGLLNLGYETEVFDFRQSQYLKSPAGSFTKKIIKKFFPKSIHQIPLVNSLENEKMNKLLLRITEEYRPDILFVLMGDGILPKTLERIRQLGIITANWFHDSVLAPNRKDFVQQISPCYDYFFMIDSEDILKHIKIGSKCVKTIPLCCIPEIHKNVNLSEEERKNYGNEISFVGTVKFKRAEVLSSLKEFDLGIWGYWLEKEAELKEYYRRQRVFGEEAVKIYNASKINLDIHLSYGTFDKKFNVTPRVFEIPASGGFLLADENPCLGELYEIGKEVVCYNDEADLKEKIRYYLEHSEERKLIAQKGRQRAYRDHTYEKRLLEIFSIINKK